MDDNVDIISLSLDIKFVDGNWVKSWLIDGSRYIFVNVNKCQGIILQVWKIKVIFAKRTKIIVFSWDLSNWWNMGLLRPDFIFFHLFLKSLKRPFIKYHNLNL